MPGNITGPLIENFIKNKYFLDKNLPSKCVGDLSKNGIDYEIKFSGGGKQNNKFNFVQIRMNHMCEYIFICYHISETNIDNFGELYTFRITKCDMLHLLVEYGSYSHGTTIENGDITYETVTSRFNKKEYSLRPKYGDRLWNALLRFRVNITT